jgi:cytochrome c biogenesis protein CcmG/thiol:disulfide interchange protein DsbE
MKLARLGPKGAERLRRTARWRNAFVIAAAVMLSLVLAGSIRAQSSPSPEPQTVAKNAPPPRTSASSPADATTISTSLSRPNVASAANDNFTEPEQPLTLGELARRERARKASQPKAVKIFDDENMPRAPISTGEKAPGFADQGSSSSGKVTLLDFWATWCGPCRHALPGLKQIQSVYGGDQLEIISVSEDDDEDAWHNFVAQNDMTWTQRLDSGHEMMRQYGASALPTYVLIGKDGAVVNQYVGDDPDVPIVERIGPDLKKSLE